MDRMNAGRSFQIAARDAPRQSLLSRRARGPIQLGARDASSASAGTRVRAQREIDLSSLAGQTNPLLDLSYVKAGSFRLPFHVLANRKLASMK